MQAHFSINQTTKTTCLDKRRFFLPACLGRRSLQGGEDRASKVRNESISTRPNRWPGFQTTERFMSCRTRLQGSPPRFQTTKHPVHRECHRMLRSVCNQATFHPKKNCSNVEFNLSLCQCDRALTQTQGRGDSSKSRAQANDRQTKRHVHVDGSETWPMPAISSTI